MQKYLRLALLAALLMATCIDASSVSVSANVLVYCPYSVTFNSLPAYLISNDISLSYIISTSGPCSISSMAGTFSLLDSNNNLMLQKSLPVSAVNNIPQNVMFSFNAVGLATGNYIGKVQFPLQSASNTSSSDFELIGPANIIISRLYASSAGVGTPIGISFNLTNDGGFA